MAAIVVAAGGTGGHMFPAEALAHELKERGHVVYLATDARGARFSERFPVAGTLMLDAATISFKKPLSLISSPATILRGTRQAAALFKQHRVAVVVGFGGYPTVPSLLAAKALGLRTIIHDQNAIPGRVNRIFAALADVVACGFTPQSRDGFARRAEVMGNPARPGFAEIAVYAPPKGDAPIHVLVTGGSQGARVVGEVIPQALAALPERLRKRLKVSQQTRPEGVGQAEEVYRLAGITAEVAPFFSDMIARLSTAHLVIGRAGASTVTELAVAGRPALLIPFAAAADDHQTANARTLVDTGGSVMVAEGDATVDRLKAELADLLDNAARLALMADAARSQGRPDAAKTLAVRVEELLSPAVRDDR